MQDADRLTLGMWVDYIIEWNNMREAARDNDDEPENRTEVRVKDRAAVQADFDAF